MTPAETPAVRIYRCSVCSRRFLVRGRVINGVWAPYEPALWMKTQRRHAAEDGGRMIS